MLIVLIAGFAYLREDKSSTQGFWICENGQWAPSGNPNFSKPDEPCAIGEETDEHDCLISAGYSWCENKQKCLRTWEETCIINLENIESGQIISSPLVIKGEAPGTWFFEASFPINLYDNNDQSLAQGYASAQKDWMTTDTIPFEAVLEFSAVSGGDGRLVFKKDNPSGLPENDFSESVSVKFKDEELEDNKQIKVELFFGNSRLAPEDSCEADYPIVRTIAKTEAVGRAAIGELLGGPTQEEKDQGYFTSINEGTELKNLVIKDGVAEAEFNELLDKEVGGSCRVGAIRSQITNTLRQFPTVDQVLISINGRTEDILQP